MIIILAVRVPRVSPSLFSLVNLVLEFLFILYLPRQHITIKLCSKTRLKKKNGLKFYQSIF